MDKNIEKLVNYQEVDKELKVLEDEVRKSDESQKYLTAKKFLSTVNDSLSALESKAKVIVDSYNLAMTEIEKLKKTAEESSSTIDSCESENELNYFKKKFQSTIDAISNLEGKINSLSKEMDDVLKEFNKLRVATKQMKAQYEEYGPKFKALKDSKDAEMNKLKVKLEKLKADIDPVLMEKYQTRRNDKKFPIIYGVDISTNSVYCPACATEMSLSQKNELASGEIKECETCRKLLYALEK
ncbi:MAG: hypothetical protein IKA85_06945 [Clostridia bacterium]|nr:hypothetical protein [Clostridia bacterium]